LIAFTLSGAVPKMNSIATDRLILSVRMGLTALQGRLSATRKEVESLTVQVHFNVVSIQTKFLCPALMAKSEQSIGFLSIAA